MSQKQQKLQTKEVQEESLWGAKTKQAMALTILIKLMNTQVCLLCDKGIRVSDRALNGYCQIHRLMLALIREYPDLKDLVRRRLDTFLKNPDKRVKKETPSIGDIFCLLSVSDEISWRTMLLPVMLESFDRSVLWSCTKDASLAIVNKGDASRLKAVFDAQTVSLRIKAFHAVFIDLLVRGGGSPQALEDCSDRYDLFSGRPPLALQNELRDRVHKIMSMNTWSDYFQLSCIPEPSSDMLLRILEEAVSNSLKKGYHSETTNFDNVHRSGVSKILLKGESYSAAPNLSTMRVIERWKFDGETIYLDASCLIYNFTGDLIGTVDYSHRSWGKTPTGFCVQHSGDVVEGNNGTHTIDIDVRNLPHNVGALYFTVTGWTTCLSSISQPSCHLHDVDSDVELCSYMYEGLDTGDMTAAIMCKLHRPSPEGRWKLTTLGHLGYGRASDYTPILEDIESEMLDAERNSKADELGL